MLKLLVILLLLTNAAFAGSFIKTDSGDVSWDMEIRSKTGHLVIRRFSQNADTRNLNPEERQTVTMELFTFSSLGTIFNESVLFRDTDERSQETVNRLIQSKLIGEISQLKVDVKRSEVSFQNVSCVEKGWLNKKLNCKATFTSKMELIFN